MSEVEPLADPSEIARPPDQTVMDAARAHDRDRYLAALLAPSDAREDLVALAAYLGEVRRIPLAVRDPAIGEIRLQWWRDIFTAGQASGHPVADAVLDLQRRRSVDRDMLLAPIEGTSRELYEDGIQDGPEFAQYADETEGAAIRLALAVLGGPNVRAAEGFVEPAARALMLTRLALTLPQHLAHGRLPLPADFPSDQRDPRGAIAEEAKGAARGLILSLAEEATRALAQYRNLETRPGADLMAAFLPLSLVEPYLKAAVKPNRDVLVDVADISPLSRVMRLWFAHWRGRI